MTMKRTVCVCVAAVFATLVAAAPAAAQKGVKVGVLTCDVSAGWGLIFGSSKDVKCRYAPAEKGAKVEHYKGTITKFGADIGYSQAAVMVWGVIAPTKDMKAGSLAGTYAGATGGAAIGVGASANVLVGGMDKSMTLQPVSIEGQTGLNVAAGVAALTLEVTD